MARNRSREAETESVNQRMLRRGAVKRQHLGRWAVGKDELAPGVIGHGHLRPRIIHEDNLDPALVGVLRSGETITVEATFEVPVDGAEIEWDTIVAQQGFTSVAVPTTDLIVSKRGAYYDLAEVELTWADWRRFATVEARVNGTAWRSWSDERGASTVPFTVPLSMLTMDDVVTVFVDHGDDGAHTITARATLQLIDTVGDIVPPSVFWWTDFSEYESGTDMTPSDWATIAGSTSPVGADWSVEDLVGATGGKVLRHPPSAGWTWVAWEQPPLMTDMEIVARVRALSDLDDMGILARATENNGYQAIAHPGGPWFRIYKLVDGTLTQLATISPDIDPDVWYWIRLRCEGDQISAKLWDSSDPEPEDWDLAVTDGSIAQGWAGIGSEDAGPSSGDTNEDRQVDVVGVSNTGTAPMEDPTT